MLLGAMPMIMPAVHASEPAVPAFWLVPDSFSFNTAAHPYVGDLFNVTVWAKIDTGQTLYAYNIGMTFDYTQIECTRVGYTNDAKSMLFTGQATSPVTAVWDNTTGSVLAGESLQGSNFISGPLSNSTVWVEFEIVAAPAPGNPPLTSTITVNTVDTYFLDKICTTYKT